jgi:hypothetical protein
MVERTEYLDLVDPPSRLITHPDDVDNPILAFFLSKWRNAPKLGRLPLNTEIAADVTSSLNEWIAVANALDEYKDFRFGFVGSRLSAYFGGGSRGKTLSEVFSSLAPRNLEVAISLYRRTCTEELPIRVTAPKGQVNGLNYADFDALYLPYAGARGKAETVLSVFTFNYEAFLASRWIGTLFSADGER